MSDPFILLRKSALGPKAKDRGAIHLLALDSCQSPVGARYIVPSFAHTEFRTPPSTSKDAAILRVAERDLLRKIFTTDRRDFSVYRLRNRTRPTLIP
jgi:hypothetical protein